MEIFEIMENCLKKNTKKCVNFCPILFPKIYGSQLPKGGKADEGGFVETHFPFLTYFLLRKYVGFLSGPNSI